MNGVRTECSHVDFGALAPAATTPALLVLLAVALLAAAGRHVVTGLGTVGDPCS